MLRNTAVDTDAIRNLSENLINLRLNLKTALPVKTLTLYCHHQLT